MVRVLTCQNTYYKNSSGLSGDSKQLTRHREMRTNIDRARRTGYLVEMDAPPFK